MGERCQANHEIEMDEKKEELFRKQKELLDTFLAHGAISQAQYDKSLSVLKEKLLEKKDED